MAKAKRERRTSIRTLQTEGGLDFLDKLEEIDRQQKAEQGVEDEPRAAQADEADDEEERA